MKPFKEIEGWLLKYSKSPQEVTVTGIEEFTRVWVIDGKGNRTKEYASCVAYKSDKNASIISEIIEKKKQLAEIDEAVDKLLLSLDRIKIEP